MTKNIPLTQEQFAIVDDDDYEYLMQWKWCASFDEKADSYYAVRGGGIRGIKKVLMHRIVAKTPEGVKCDHKNHNTLDNRKDNLRNVTNSESMVNRRIQKNNKLGIKNITSCKPGFYRVSIAKDNKTMFDKTFRSLDKAIEARDRKLSEIHGEFACKERKFHAETAQAEAELLVELITQEV